MVIATNKRTYNLIISVISVFLLLNASEIVNATNNKIKIENIYIIGFFLTVVAYFLKQKVKFRVNLNVLVFVFFITIIFLHSLILSPDPISDRKSYEALILFPLILFTYLSIEDRENFLKYFLIFSGFYMIITCLSFFYNIDNGVITTRERVGSIGDSYHRVGRLAIFSFVGGYYLWNSKPILAKIFIITSFLAVIFSANRSGFVALVILFFIINVFYRKYLWFSKRAISQNILLIIFIFILLIYINSNLNIFLKSTYIFDRLQILKNYDELINNGRFIMWNESIKAYLNSNMLFGLGFGKFSEATGLYIWRQPHNIIIELITELGIFSFLYFYLLINSFKRSSAISRFILIGLFIQALTGGDITDNRHLLFFIMFRT